MGLAHASSFPILLARIYSHDTHHCRGSWGALDCAWKERKVDLLRGPLCQGPQSPITDASVDITISC